METLVVPIVDLDRPSCAFRENQAKAVGQPYLDINDFLKLPCGHQVDPNALSRCLSKQLRYYELMHALNIVSCSVSKCDHYISQELRSIITRGRVDFKIEFTL